MKKTKQWIVMGMIIAMLWTSQSVQAMSIEQFLQGSEIPIQVNLQTGMPVGFSVARKSINIHERLDMYTLLTADGNFTWRSSNTDIVRINQNGIAQGFQIGEATITATDEQNRTYTCILSVGYKLGMDVSTFNKNVDWRKVKAQGMEFAMLRSSYGWNDNFANDPDGQIDAEFAKNLKGVVENDIPFGVYHYAYATNVAQAKAEANYFLYTMSRMPQEYISKISLPVAYDLEDRSIANSGIGKEGITQLAKTFCNTIAEAGYMPMVYANKNWFVNNIDVPDIVHNGYKLWYAQYLNNPNIAQKPNVADSGYYPMIWQYASDGIVEGAISTSGGTDMNVMYLPETTFALLGDADKDGEVKLHDVYTVLQTLAEGKEIDAEMLKRADVDENGTVEAYDAYLILQYTVGNIEIF